MPFIFRLSTVLAVTALSAALSAQRPEFEVTSVKVHLSGDAREFMVALPGGRFEAANTSLKMLIRSAFQLQNDQIVGGPAWMSTDRFDVEARAPGGYGPNYSLLAGMMQSLLSDRFKLATHTEKRELPVFALERARRDGTTGTGLVPTACPELSADLSTSTPCATIQNGFGSMRLRGMPMNQFVPFLSANLNRVVDRTGRPDRYDMDLKWTPDPANPGSAGVAPAADPNAVSIFTALQEQLGLRLTATRAMVDVLVIDSLEHPTPN